MQLHIRRFLSTAVLSILLTCSALSPLSLPVHAESADVSSYLYSSKQEEYAELQLSKRSVTSSLREAEDASPVNKKAIQAARLVTENGKIRCRLSNGKYLKKSWKTFGKKTYYFNTKGFAATGLQKIGKHHYIFTSKGILRKGWIKYRNHWYYGSVSNKGRLKTGWQTIGGKRYYLSVLKLYRFTGLKYIAKKFYFFNSKGVQLTTNQVVNGKKIVFNKDGSVYSYGGQILSKSSSSSLSKGQQVVNYAKKFVGNPYKWGGSSLTNGADCSGFVMAVYAHFGIQLPHYDAAIRQCGKAVNGLANAQPGDVICYDGHVAIYMGSGRIIHAADYQYGICIWNNAAYDRILSIRRFF